MKNKFLLFTIFFVALTWGLNAQTVIFQDDFESYSGSDNLTSYDYEVWEGQALVTDITVSGGTAYSGSKFAECTPDANNFYLRKTFTLEEGKTYTFEVATKSPDAKNHRVVAKVGERTVQSDLISNTEWAKTTINFTVGTGETSVVLWIYSYPINKVDVDDFILTQESTSSVSTIAENEISIYPNPSNGVFNISGSKSIESYAVYDISGHLVKQALCNGQSDVVVDMSNETHGLYIMRINDVNGEIYNQKVTLK